MIAAGLACVDLVIISQDPDRVRIYCRLGLAADTVGFKTIAANFVRQVFGKDAPCGITGTEKN